MERMDITAIENIKDIADNGSVIATIKTRTHIRSRARNKTSGKMITGILCDNTASIDFVCWGEAAEPFNDILSENKTYNIKNVKVIKANENYSRSSHKYQLVIGLTSSCEILD